MTQHDEHEARVRLEGGAELLEATRLRYHALVLALRAVRWRKTLLRSADVLREVARVQPEVEAARSTASRHAAQAHWPATSRLAVLLREVSAVRDELHRLAQQRLDHAGPLSECLALLVTQVLDAPVTVPVGKRWSTAVDVLHAAPDLHVLREWLSLLASMFSRPAPPGGEFPYAETELQALGAGWSRGAAALERTWQRLASRDATGAMVKAVRQRATRPPRGAAVTGADLLAQATWWQSLAKAHLAQATSQHVSMLSLRDDEQLTVARWLSAPGQRLLLPPSRAAFVQLCHAFTARGPATVLARDWPVLREWAHAAEAEPSAEVARVLEALTTLVRVAETKVTSAAGGPLARSLRRPTTSPRSAGPPTTLTEAVERLHQLAKAPT